jgi:hypothetical protein
VLLAVTAVLGHRFVTLLLALAAKELGRVAGVRQQL